MHNKKLLPNSDGDFLQSNSFITKRNKQFNKQVLTQNTLNNQSKFISHVKQKGKILSKILWLMKDKVF